MTCIYLVDPDTSENACPTGVWDIIYPENYENMKTPEKGFPAYITNRGFWLAINSCCSYNHLRW